MKEPSETPGRTRQWLWFVGLWAAGVVAVGVVAFLLRSMFRVILA